MKYIELIISCLFSRATSWGYIYREWKKKHDKKEAFKRALKEVKPKRHSVRGNTKNKQ
jgi:hypothetical protein